MNIPSTSDYINIVMAADKNFLIPLAVTMTSILENINSNKRIRFFILSHSNDDMNKINRLVIYGTGEIASFVFKKIKNEIDVLYFVESSPRQSTYMDKEIKSPHSLSSINNNVYILIASLSFCNEIKEEIIKM